MSKIEDEKVVITQDDVGNGRVKEIVRDTTYVQSQLKDIRSELSGPLRVGSQLVHERGIVWVRIRVKIKGASVYFPYDLAKDPVKVISKLFDMGRFWWKYESSIQSSDWCVAFSRAVAELALEDPVIQQAISQLIARATKLVNGRNMSEKRAQVKSAYIQSVLKRVASELSEISDDISEDDVVRIWREVLVEKVQHD